MLLKLSGVYRVLISGVNRQSYRMVDNHVRDDYTL